ncbi:sigma-70 family RNA polymerase sigma factor [Aquabacterium sp. J223]|uniref:sigma-70 family RNA polymerase sigma factor n=1 Tax=Aquabacterium sp. J223 TaxID=2898431 RepID=UPI0021AE2973|nr:sigma-70 family RNA polymerase sigma factor [Aquabacterium sp. J223]UUX94403.1 sigma-70 family RNA polymerase sigma factor [Aquabacterium sp. J223]
MTLVRSSAVRADSTQPAAEELVAWVHAVAVRQDRQAFALLFKHFAPRVKSYLQRTGASEELAEEVVQETMVSLWRKAAMFDARQAAVSTWVFTIARNLRIDALRRRGPVGAYEDEGVTLDALVDQAPLPEDRVRQARRDEGLHAAINRLPAEQAQVLRLSFFEERPHAQIASELGIPLGTVKSRVRLAVAHIRRLLNHLE